MTGRCSIFDLVQAKNGVRSELWHGFLWRARPPEKVAEWKAREAELQNAANRQLAAMRLFVTNNIQLKRTRERLEAAVMKRLYEAPAPFRDMPDQGMGLKPKRNSEQPITVLNDCASNLHCLPERLPI